VVGRTDPDAGPAGGPADTAGTRVGGLADTVADSAGDRAAVVGSVTAVGGMADRPEESAGSEIPTAARAGALGVPVPCRGQAARRGDSIPANRRARALAELSPAQLCLIKLSALRRTWVIRRNPAHNKLTRCSPSAPNPYPHTLVPIHVLRKIAGHADLSTTQRYLHPDRQSVAGAGELLSKHLWSQNGPKLRIV
jgi:hypothetical protein